MRYVARASFYFVFLTLSTIAHGWVAPRKRHDASIWAIALTNRCALKPVGVWAAAKASKLVEGDAASTAKNSNTNSVCALNTIGAPIHRGRPQNNRR